MQNAQVLQADAIEGSVRAADAVMNEVKKVIKGKDEIVQTALLCILAGGHILLEDIPGVGKTTMALAFSKAMQLQYNRVQFTPDVMPGDVTGYTIYRKESGQFEYVKGAALCNLFLADEINRTSSKTQSALLEVMEEGRVTVDMKTYEAPKPFTVIATQNPITYAGTQMLPESQLDRFMVRLSMGYPDKESELAILKSKESRAADMVRPILSAEDLLHMQGVIESVFVHDAVYMYGVELVHATRSNSMVELGASPRGTLSLVRLAKARALLQGRGYVLPDDMQYVWKPCMTHRIVLKSRARVSSATVDDVLDEIIKSVPVPRIRVS